MKVLAIIPSRYGSSRFPGKPLIDIKGKSMIQRVYEQTSQAKLVSKVVVATDDERIEKEVQRFGGAVKMTSSMHQSGTERCGEVIKTFSEYDVVINIQGDEPLIQPEQIDQVLELFKSGDVEIGTVVKAIKSIDDVDNPNRVKVVLNGKSEAIYFSRSPIPFVSGQPKETWLNHTKFWKHIGIYAWKKHTLEAILDLPVTTIEKLESLEQLRWLYHGLKIQTVETDIETPNIDTPDDLEKVIKVLEEN